MARAKLDDPRRDGGAHDLHMAEEEFLLSVQTILQKLLNDRDLRYRDLAKRLGVTEARVSQMFGDTAANLTIRSIARVFHLMGESPVLLSREELRRRLAEARGAGSEAQPRWSVSGANDGHLVVEDTAELVDENAVARDRPQPKPSARDWAIAEAAAGQRRAA